MWGHPTQQIQFLMYMNLVILMYKGYFKPIAWRLQQWVDVWNELTICVATMHMLFFTDWVPDYEV